MSPFWLLPALALSGAVGIVGTYIRVNLWRDAEEAKRMIRAKQEAYRTGQANGWHVASLRAADTLKATYPTSRGGKAIVKALNAGPDPESRITTAHVSTAESRAISNFPDAHTVRVINNVPYVTKEPPHA